MRLNEGQGVITLRLDNELKSKVEEAAKKDHRSVTQYLIVLLEREVNKGSN